MEANVQVDELEVGKQQLTEAEVENALLKAQIEQLTKELSRFKGAIVSLINEKQEA